MLLGQINLLLSNQLGFNASTCPRRRVFKNKTACLTLDISNKVELVDMLDHNTTIRRSLIWRQVAI